MVEFSYVFSGALGVLTIVVAFVYFLLGIDDLAYDVLFWVRSASRATRRFPPLTLTKIRAKEEQRVAILIPCWHEDEVVDQMLEFAVTSLDYQHYDIFVGTYPNDPATIEKVRAVARRHDRVKLVINPLPGPTTKAQNLNAIFAEIERLDGDDPYQIMVLHDTEDVIHPLSLRMYNFLMPQREMIQLPVFPLERPMFEWTSWTYADEFAENHQKDMVVREAIGSFVPSAGVGCAFSRAALEIISVTAPDVFPLGTLTEDYVTGLRFRLRGLSTIFVSQRLSRMKGQRFSTAASYVATRGYFPDTLRNAVRQKARWVVGICFQSWQATGWVGPLSVRYALYRDRKSVAANIFALFGYPVVASLLVMSAWHFFNPRIVVPSVGSNQFVWLLLDFVLALTAWRLLNKAFFVAALYGPTQGLLSLVRPPWAAVINGLATIRAIGLFTQAIRQKSAVVWNKTDHLFPSAAVLGEFHRQLGQVLIERNDISEADLAKAMQHKHTGERIGAALVRLGFIHERVLIAAVADQTGALTALDDDLLANPEALALVPHALAEEHRWLPLRVAQGTLEFACSTTPSQREIAELRASTGQAPVAYLVEPARLDAAIARAYRYGDHERGKPLGVYLVDRGFIARDALDRYLALPDPLGRRLFERLVDNDALGANAVREIVTTYFGLPVTALPVHLDALPPTQLAKVHELVRTHPGLAIVSNAGVPALFASVPVEAFVLASVAEALGTHATFSIAPLNEVRTLRARMTRWVTEVSVAG